MITEDKETIEGLLSLLDRDIDHYAQAREMIRNEYGVAKGEEQNLHRNEYDSFVQRMDHAHQIYQGDSKKHMDMLDVLCKKIRREQPSLHKLTPANISESPWIPKDIVLGRIRVQYENFDETMSRTIPFPVSRPVYINDGRFVSLHKLYLRLMYTLPLGKCTFRVFDPEYLGAGIADFNFSLASEKSIFPDGKVLVNQREMTEALDETVQYARNLLQNVFNSEHRDWESYNLWRYSQQDYNRMLEYKVLTFFGLPYGLNQENFNYFCTLSNICRRCGILIIFSYDQELFKSIKGKSFGVDKTIEYLKSIVERSSCLKNVVHDLSRPIQVKHLDLSELEEEMPGADGLSDLLIKYRQHMEARCKRAVITFNDMVPQDSMYTGNATFGLKIPLGEKSIDKTILYVEIGDETPHYLIGGSTGSGKSNLLHNLIVSACWNYSSEELSLYLLDFKLGTEFNVYAAGRLSHAKLIAVAGDEIYDVEYGVSVMAHLEQEIKRRGRLFKELPDCNDYKTYRQLAPKKILPRVLVIIDEFQVLLNGKGVMARLLSLAKQGRSFGLHMIMATQTLRGLDVNALGTQFRGRVALKCSAEDSAQLLGGAASTNSAASRIRIPDAIMNIASGFERDNIVFAVAEAKHSSIARAVSDMTVKAGVNNNDLKVYNGQAIPEAPKGFSGYNSSRVDLILGYMCDYQGDYFKVSLRQQEENNLLIVGKDNEDTGVCAGLLQALLVSGSNSDAIDRIIYIGGQWGNLPEVKGLKVKKLSDTEDIDLSKGTGWKLVEAYASFSQLVEKNDFFDIRERVLLIIDNCNLVKELNIEPAGYGKPKYSGNAEKLISFISDCNLAGSYVVALYNSLHQLDKKGLPYKDYFLKRIAFGMSDKDKNILGGLTLANKDRMPDHRAVYMEEMGSVWFKPYETRQEEADG